MGTISVVLHTWDLSIIVLFSKECVKRRGSFCYYSARQGFRPLCLRITHSGMRNQSCVVRSRKYLCVGWFYLWEKGFQDDALRHKNEFDELYGFLPWIRVLLKNVCDYIVLKSMGGGDYSRQQVKRLASKIIRVRVGMLHSHSFSTT